MDHACVLGVVSYSVGWCSDNGEAMKYLDLPCPRKDCGAATMCLPQKSGSKIYSSCSTCKRKSLYVIHVSKSGDTYSLVPVGTYASKRKVRMQILVREDQRDALNAMFLPRTLSSNIREAIDNYIELQLQYTI